MNAKEHPTYRFLMERQKMEPGRPIFLIVAGKPILAQLNDEENDDLALYDLAVSENGKPAAWRDDDFMGLEWRCTQVLAHTTEESIEWLEKKSRKGQKGAYYITSSLDVDYDAAGATSMGKATARGLLELYGEWDDIPHDEQLEKIKTLNRWGLKTHQVTSGGASVHWHIPFDRLVAMEEAMPLLKMVTALMGSDVCCVSQARRMRLPGLFRREGDKVTKQELLHLEPHKHSVQEVRMCLEQAFQREGWSYSEKRWSMFRRNDRRKAAGKPLTNQWTTPTQAWSCDSKDLLLFNCNESASGDGGELPPMWLRTEHHLGKRIRQAQDQIFLDLGLIGAYELALTKGDLGKSKLAADGKSPFSFDFHVRHGGEIEDFPAEANGNSPFSDTNHSGSSFVLFGENRRWWCRKNNEGGQLAELLLYFCPGISDPEEPSDREQQRFLLWITELAGMDVEESAQLFTDGQYGEEMKEIEKLIAESVRAEGNPLETEAVNQRARQMKIREPELLNLKLHLLGGTLRSNGSTGLDDCKEHPDNIETPVVFDFLHRNHVGVVGPPSAGKTTFFGGFLAERVISGHDVVIDGRVHKTVRGNVLIVSSDAGTASIKRDLIKQGVDLDDPNVKARIRFLSDLKYNDMSLIVKTMQEFQPDVSFFDSFLTLKSPGVKIADDDCASPLSFLTRSNGVIFPQHLILTALHTQRGNNRGYLGSTAIRAALDSMCSYTEPDKTDPDEPSGPLRLLSYLGDDMKCRNGNRNRVWAVRYEELEGTWQITEVKKEGKQSVTTMLRTLIEAKPTLTWLRLGTFLKEIGGEDAFESANARKTVQRHLKAMSDLIDTRQVDDPQTHRSMTEYRVVPSVYNALMNTERGFVALNTVGQRPKPVSAAKPAEPAPIAEQPRRDASRPAEGDAVDDPAPTATKPAKRGRKARKAKQVTAAPKEWGANPTHKVGDLPGDLDWSKLESVSYGFGSDLSTFTRPLGAAYGEETELAVFDQSNPPDGSTPMAVLEDGAWRNGWKFRCINPSGLVAVSARAASAEKGQSTSVYECFPADRVMLCPKKTRV